MQAGYQPAVAGRFVVYEPGTLVRAVAVVRHLGAPAVPGPLWAPLWACGGDVPLRLIWPWGLYTGSVIKSTYIVISLPNQCMKLKSFIKKQATLLKSSFYGLVSFIL